MIDSKDLRIGNYVTDKWYESSKTIIIVESIDDKGINLEIENDGNYPELSKNWIEPYYIFDDIFGIPLTEDILLKCGFEFYGYGENTVTFKGYRFKEFDLLFLDDDNRSIEFMNNINEKVYCNLQFLHQLQNLYFALTNQELEIKI